VQALVADFELSEGIYSRAKIEDTDSVCLWLGANVMLEYSCDEVTLTILISIATVVLVCPSHFLKFCRPTPS
jgi:hypothetical protein